MTKSGDIKRWESQFWQLVHLHSLIICQCTPKWLPLKISWWPMGTKQLMSSSAADLPDLVIPRMPRLVWYHRESLCKFHLLEVMRDITQTMISNKNWLSMLEPSTSRVRTTKLTRSTSNNIERGTKFGFLNSITRSWSHSRETSKARNFVFRKNPKISLYCILIHKLLKILRIFRSDYFLRRNKYPWEFHLRVLWNFQNSFLWTDSLGLQLCKLRRERSPLSRLKGILKLNKDMPPAIIP